MSTVDVSIRLEALNGQWETCGADRAIGVDAESVVCTADGWGPKTASFTLKRTVIALWPDLSAYTPIEIEIGGVIVWEGRIAETPVKDGAEQQINVQGEGWQAQLDDDVFLHTYVHSKLSDWKDARSFTNADLTKWLTAPQVQAGSGAITLSFPQGSSVIENVTWVGVILDLGPGAVAKRVVLEVAEGSFAAGNYVLVCRGADNVGELTGTEPEFDQAFFSDPATIAGATAGSFTSTHRYVAIMIHRTGATGSETADRHLKLTAIKVFSDTTYESGNLSVLTGDVIEKDALERGTLLLSTDYTQIAARSFHIPDFIIAKASTPREVIEAANAYYNYITKLLVGRRFSSQPRPTAPLLEIGSWSQADTEDTSANSGAEIYDRALIEATGTDGSPLVVERSAGQQPGASPTAYGITTPAPENPSFAVNTATWSITGAAGTLTRDTTVFNTAPASGRVNATPKAFDNAAHLTETLSGTFKHGITYKLTVQVKTGAMPTPAVLVGELGTAGDYATAGLSLTPESAFQQFTITWTPTEDRTGVTLRLAAEYGAAGAATLWVDDVVLYVLKPTLIDRRGFRRTKVIQMSSAITQAEGNQLGDIFLQSHMTTPFKGSASLSPGSIRRVLGGQPVHPSQLLLYTQQLIRLGNLIDPDTGGIGRNGMIAEVSYDHKTQRAQVTLDDPRNNFDALLQRLAVVQVPGS